METVLLLQKEDDYPCVENTDLKEELVSAYKRIALLEEGIKRGMEEKDILKEKINLLTDKQEVMALNIDCLKGLHEVFHKKQGELEEKIETSAENVGGEIQIVSEMVDAIKQDLKEKIENLAEIVEGEIQIVSEMVDAIKLELEEKIENLAENVEGEIQMEMEEGMQRDYY